MKKIIQKFGGTSLDTAEKRQLAVRHIQGAVESGYSPVVVVSAMGRVGEPYATDTLIKLAEEAYLEIKPREKDLIMSCGEIISAVIMVQSLKGVGLEAIALNGAQAGIFTDNRFGESEVIRVDPARILSICEAGIIPVVAGFQGISDDGETTTLGRGGSDTTASVLAAAVQALFIEIYTDVEGIMTADPTMVKNARRLEQVSYYEVCELAYQGARVIHPRAAEIAMREGIPIKVKSTFRQDDPGTLIDNYGFRGIKGDQSVTGVTSRNNIIFVKITPEKMREYATGLKVFRYLANHGISIDFINIHPEYISFIVESRQQDKVADILEEYDFNFIFSDSYAKVSIVGGGMTGKPGVMARLVEALTERGIAVYQTTDSQTTISCLVRNDQEVDALNALHDAFELKEIRVEDER